MCKNKIEWKKKIKNISLNACNTLSICHGKFVLKTNSKMLQQFKILLLALIFRLVLSNYEDYSIDSTTSDESCIEPIETGTESNCYCYSQPENDFEHSICAPKKCPLDDANYRSVHGRCFYFENERKTFVNSRENCKSKGGKLYEPKDVVEMNEIAQLSGLAKVGPTLGLANWFWIGLRII